MTLISSAGLGLAWLQSAQKSESSPIGQRLRKSFCLGHGAGRNLRAVESSAGHTFTASD